MGLEPQKILCECLHAEPLQYNVFYEQHLLCSLKKKKKTFILCAFFSLLYSQGKTQCLMSAVFQFLGHIMSYILKYYLFFV